MVGLAVNHDWYDVFVKIVDIKREPGRETGFPLFFSD